MDVLHAEFDTAEKTSDEAEQRRLRKLFLFLLRFSFSFPGFRIRVFLFQFFFILFLFVLAQLVTILLSLGSRLFLLVLKSFFFGLLQLLYNLMHHSDVGQLVIAVVGAVLGIVREIRHL